MEADVGPKSGFEFSDEQNVEFRGASYWMGIMGRLGILLGGLTILFGALATRTDLQSGAMNLIAGIIGVIIGTWTLRAAAAFGRVADTRGQDVACVMDAVANLKNLYRLQSILIGIAFAMMILAVVVMLFAANSAPRPV